MTLQIINTGTSPNAGNGDSIRSAFNKVNQNFNLLNGMILGTGTNFNSGVREVVKPMLVHNSHNGITAAYNSINDRIILGLDVSDATFNNLQVNNNATFNNVAITGTVNIGIVQGFDDVNIIKFANIDQSLNLRIKNTWGLGSSEINLLDDIEGGLNIVHQNSSGNQGVFQFGQNYIYDDTTKALNIGRRSNINFYADQGWSSYGIPTVSISNTGTVNVQSTLTLAKNFISLDGNILSVSTASVSLNGVNIVREPDRLIAGDYTVVLNTAGNIILPGDAVIAYTPYSPPGQTVTNYGALFNIDGPFEGAGSIDFNGSSRIEVAGGDPFDLTTGTYTIEWFQKPTVFTESNVYSILSLGTVDQQVIEVTNSYNGIYTATSAVLGGSFQLDGIYSTEILNTWTHIALVKTTSSFSVFVNGVQTISTNTGLFPTPISTSSNLIIGSPVFFVNYSPYVGLISNMRWEARDVYTANFVPPSSILTASVSTRLLLAPTTAKDFLWDTAGTSPEIPQTLSWQLDSSSLTLDSQGVLKLDQDQSYDSNDLAGTTFRIDTDQPNYTQIYVKNHNQGITATSDLVIFNNTTTEDTGYIDLGINSTNYDEGIYGLHGPGSGYLFTKDVDLVVGTQGQNTRLLFHAGGDTVNDSAGELNAFYWKFNRSVQTIVSTPGPLNFTVWNTQNNSASKAVYQAMNNSGEYVHLGINSSNAGAFYGNIGPSDSFIHNHETTSTLHIGAQGNLAFYSDQINGFYGTATLIMSRLDRSSTFAGHVLPASDLTYDLGSSSTQWRSLYVGTSTIYIGGVPITVNRETNTLVVGTTPGTTSTTATNLATESFVIDYVAQNGGGGGGGGDLQLPRGGSITENIVTNELWGSTTTSLTLIPGGAATAEQRLEIYSTAGGEGNHIHITSGDQSQTDLFLGNDTQYFAVDANGYNVIQARTGQDSTASGISASAGSSVTIYAGSAGDNGGNVADGASGGDIFLQSGSSSAGLGGYIYLESANGPDGYGSIRLSTDGSSTYWTFDKDDKLTFPNGAEIRDVNGDLRLRAAAGEVTQLQGLDGSGFVDSAVKVFYNSGSYVTINTNIDSGSPEHIWTFDYNGDLTVPNYINFAGNTFIGDEPGAGTPVFRIVTPLGYGATIETDSDIEGTNRVWTFGTDGSTTFPDGTVQFTAFTGTSALLDITNTNGLGTTYYLTFVEDRTTGQEVRADVDLTYQTADNILGVGQISVNATTSATSTTTGALTVAGGVGIQGDIYASNIYSNGIQLTAGGGGGGSALEQTFESKTTATGVVTHDCTTNRLFYHTGLTGNFTADFTNLNLSSGEATSISLVMVQGATARMPTAVRIEGTSTGVTLLWQGSSTAPAGNANRTDVVTFSVLATGTSAYTVLGMLTSFGGGT